LVGEPLTLMPRVCVCVCVFGEGGAWVYVWMHVGLCVWVWVCVGVNGSFGTYATNVDAWCVCVHVGGWVWEERGGVHVYV